MLECPAPALMLGLPPQPSWHDFPNTDGYFAGRSPLEAMPRKRPPGVGITYPISPRSMYSPGTTGKFPTVPQPYPERQWLQAISRCHAIGHKLTDDLLMKKNRQKCADILMNEHCEPCQEEDANKPQVTWEIKRPEERNKKFLLKGLASLYALNTLVGRAKLLKWFSFDFPPTQDIIDQGFKDLQLIQEMGGVHLLGHLHITLSVGRKLQGQSTTALSSLGTSHLANATRHTQEMALNYKAQVHNGRIKRLNNAISKPYSFMTKVCSILDQGFSTMQVMGGASLLDHNPRHFSICWREHKRPINNTSFKSQD
eukprot:Gb_24468 [translate_table: standard]